MGFFQLTATDVVFCNLPQGASAELLTAATNAINEFSPAVAKIATAAPDTKHLLSSLQELATTPKFTSSHLPSVSKGITPSMGRTC